MHSCIVCLHTEVSSRLTLTQQVNAGSLCEAIAVALYQPALVVQRTMDVYERTPMFLIKNYTISSASNKEHSGKIRFCCRTLGGPKIAKI